MKGLFIINPSSGKQNIDSMLREIMATLILDQICSHVDVFYTILFKINMITAL